MTDAEQRYRLLDLSSVSMHTFIDDVLAAISIRVDSTGADLAGDATATRHAAITGLLEEGPAERGLVEAQLGYSLSGPHTAAIIWREGTRDTADFRTVVEVIARGSHPLTVSADPSALWMWLPVELSPEATEPLRAELSRFPGLRVGIGRAGRDLDGFRASHRDALATRQVLARLGSSRPVTHFRDVQLVSLLATDLARASSFLRDTLGALLDADVEIQRTVDTYIAEHFNTSRTAARLYTHRNTVVRRLARADELLPRPLSRNHVEVAAALAIVRLSRE
ncbi:PucR family transcriptional regulator [Nocardia sp. NPDC056100]|uniref:PucR family transcriptional regulator n=1 Tax=Nocardia sp. NPDC056100 TaxID=3345712 RepID=UPI0035D7F7A5